MRDYETETVMITKDTPAEIEVRMKRRSPE